MNLSENDIKEYGLHISDSDAKYYKEHLHELLEEEKNQLKEEKTNKQVSNLEEVSPNPKKKDPKDKLYNIIK